MKCVLLLQFKFIFLHINIFLVNGLHLFYFFTIFYSMFQKCVECVFQALFLSKFAWVQTCDFWHFLGMIFLKPLPLFELLLFFK